MELSQHGTYSGVGTAACHSPGSSPPAPRSTPSSWLQSPAAAPSGGRRRRCTAADSHWLLSDEMINAQTCVGAFFFSLPMCGTTVCSVELTLTVAAALRCGALFQLLSQVWRGFTMTRVSYRLRKSDMYIHSFNTGISCMLVCKQLICKFNKQKKTLRSLCRYVKQLARETGSFSSPDT